MPAVISKLDLSARGNTHCRHKRETVLINKRRRILRIRIHTDDGDITRHEVRARIIAADEANPAGHGAAGHGEVVNDHRISRVIIRHIDDVGVRRAEVAGLRGGCIAQSRLAAGPVDPVGPQREIGVGRRIHRRIRGIDLAPVLRDGVPLPAIDIDIGLIVEREGGLVGPFNHNVG